MKKGTDIVKKFPEIQLYHHNLPGKSVKKQNQGEHHLIIPISGNVKVIAAGKTYRFGTNKMIYIPSGTPHEFESKQSESGERIVAIIQDRFWRKNCSEEFSTTLLGINNLVKELLLHILLHCETRYHKSLSGTIINVLEELIIAKDEQDIEIAHLFAKTNDVRILKALNYIQDHADEKLIMGNISTFSGMSSRNLNRVFSEQFGINPKQLHNKLRMEKARELLKVKGQTVTEVCFSLGFSSLYQFIKSFKKTLGVLPSEV
jgi:AraC-like DNA-binding protein